MSPLDALFLQAEDGVSHMHIGSCAVFEGPAPTLAEFTRLIDGKLHLLERYRQRVRFVPGGIARPVWVDDPDFDLAFHLRHTALPAPGSERELELLMARLMSQELDRQRPLWEAWLVEGLEDDRWALISKVHHCMVDGISGTDLMAALLDPDRHAAPSDPPPWSPAPSPSDAELVARGVAELLRQPVEQLNVAGRALRSPRRLARHLGDLFEGLRSYGGRLLTPTEDLSIEGAIGPHRRWAVARTDVDRIRAVRRTFGGSVNDVVLTAVTAAFRTVLLDRGEPVDGVTFRSLVPVSVRSLDDHTPNNQVTAMIAELPIGVADPIDRLAAVRAEMDRLKVSHQAEAGVAIATAAELAPAAVVAFVVRSIAALARRLPQHRVNTVTTNVPGPQYPLYAAGREMLEYLPFVPLSHGVRIGVAILSYHGRIAFGVTADRDAVPEVGEMARHIEAAIAELVSLAERGRRAGGREVA